MSIHSRIKSRRTRLGLTEQQLADRVGVTRAAVQQWEREGGTAPRRSLQDRVAKALEITVAELLGVYEPPQSAKISTREQDSPTYQINHAWPFTHVTKAQWDSLSQYAKGEIEGRILEMARHASGASSRNEKSQKAAF